MFLKYALSFLPLALLILFPLVKFLSMLQVYLKSFLFLKRSILPTFSSRSFSFRFYI